MSSVEQDDHMGGMQAGRPGPQYKPSAEERELVNQWVVSSVVHRGIPLGILGYFSAKTIIRAGYFKKYPRLCYAGMIGLGFSIGVHSNSVKFLKKLLALENSVIAEEARKEIARLQLPMDHPMRKLFAGLRIEPATETEEFRNEFRVIDRPADDPIESQDRHMVSKWDKIRKETRQAQVTLPKENGMTYHDLRMINRARVDSFASLTPEDENNIKGKYSRQTLGKETSGADVEDFDKNKESHTEENSKKSVGGRIPRRNKYGDEVF